MARCWKGASKHDAPLRVVLDASQCDRRGPLRDLPPRSGDSAVAVRDYTALVYPVCVFISRLAIGLVGSALLLYAEWRRRTDRVQSAKDRLEWINKGGTHSW